MISFVAWLNILRSYIMDKEPQQRLGHLCGHNLNMEILMNLVSLLSRQ